MSDPQTEQPGYQWTAKLPALVVAALAIVVGLRLSRRSWAIGGGLIIAGVVVLIWSGRAGEWCAPTNTSFGQMYFGTHFFHHASFSDCLHLVHGR